MFHRGVHSCQYRKAAETTDHRKESFVVSETEGPHFVFTFLTLAVGEISLLMVFQNSDICPVLQHKLNLPIL